MRRLALLAAALLGSAPLLAQAPSQPAPAPLDAPVPSGTVTITEVDAGMLMGRNHGSGVFTFNGRDYPFTLVGIAAGASIGRAHLNASGNVYGLTDVSQFDGTYQKTDANATLGAGKGKLTLKNADGVWMSLETKSTGVRLDLAAGGVIVTMAQ
jgi:hypothetical protein